MSMGPTLLPEFDNEMALTRKTLERVPEDKLSYKPDPKSMQLDRLAGHIAEMVGWAATALTTPFLDMNPDGKGGQQPAVAKSRAQLLDMFDKNVAEARAALGKVTDAEMMQDWALKSNGKTLLAMPRIAVVRSMVLNHIIHHRAQLGVYYRLNGIPVPSVYGPSADEGMPLAADASA
jgi:uncharacterized damage-inducible protein DinB